MILEIPLNLVIAILFMTAPVPFSDHARLYLGTISLYCLPDYIIFTSILFSRYINNG